MSGGIASSVITLYYNEMLLKQSQRVVLGASGELKLTSTELYKLGAGAIYTIISFLACVAPKATFLIFGIIPLPAWGCVTGLFTWDFLNAMSQRVSSSINVGNLPVLNLSASVCSKRA